MSRVTIQGKIRHNSTTMIQYLYPPGIMLAGAVLDVMDRHSEIQITNLDDRESELWFKWRMLEEAYPGVVRVDTEFRADRMVRVGVVGDSPGSTMAPANGINISQLDGVTSVPRQVPSMSPLQEWEGWVVDMGENQFTARLTDLTAGPAASESDGIAEEEATIPYSELSEEDLNSLRPGSIFRWVIGYERAPSGTKKRVSQIVFRDLPVMTAQDMSTGEEWARRVSEAFRG